VSSQASRKAQDTVRLGTGEDGSRVMSVPVGGTRSRRMVGRPRLSRSTVSARSRTTTLRAWRCRRVVVQPARSRSPSRPASRHRRDDRDRPRPAAGFLGDRQTGKTAIAGATRAIQQKANWAAGRHQISRFRCVSSPVGARRARRSPATYAGWKRAGRWSYTTIVRRRPASTRRATSTFSP